MAAVAAVAAVSRLGFTFHLLCRCSAFNAKLAHKVHSRSAGGLRKKLPLQRAQGRLRASALVAGKSSCGSCPSPPSRKEASASALPRATRLSRAGCAVPPTCSSLSSPRSAPSSWPCSPWHPHRAPYSDSAPTHPSSPAPVNPAATQRRRRLVEQRTTGSPRAPPSSPAVPGQLTLYSTHWHGGRRGGGCLRAAAVHPFRGGGAAPGGAAQRRAHKRVQRAGAQLQVTLNIGDLIRRGEA